MRFFSITEASRAEHFNRSPGWIRAGIKLGKIEAKKVGQMFIISEDEIEKIKNYPIIISRKEMLTYETSSKK